MMVGDHPALEILNTAARVDGELVDSLPSDRDVLLWLSRVGWPAENDLAHLRADALLKSARALRATIRVFIEKRKQESGPIREPSMYSSRMPGVIWNSYRIARKLRHPPFFLSPGCLQHCLSTFSMQRPLNSGGTHTYHFAGNREAPLI
jgi:hypothetical protein